jgi:hypothetical protein
METIMNEHWAKMISKIEKEKKENQHYAPKAINIIEDTIEQIKDFVKLNDFKNPKDEIHFFKNIKPRFCSLLIYYKKIHQIELEKPLGSNEEKKNHLHFYLNSLTRYCKQNSEFYQYIKSGKTHLDDQYFIRENAKKNIIFETFANDIDFRFCTGFDFRLSVLLAYEKLENYLNKQIDILINPELNPLNYQNSNYQINYKKYNLHWTESQSALTELVYALYESKVFNEGETTILEISKCLEDAFNIKLSNVHRSFVEIKNRKNDRLKFLDGLRNRLNLLIEHSFQK